MFKNATQLMDGFPTSVCKFPFSHQSMIYHTLLNSHIYNLAMAYSQGLWCPSCIGQIMHVCSIMSKINFITNAAQAKYISSDQIHCVHHRGKIKGFVFRVLYHQSNLEME